MKMIIVFALALVAVACADVKQTQIIRSEFTQKPQGDYKFGFETDDGILRSEEGELKEALDEDNKPHQVVVVHGTYTYKNSDGTPETINYFADENGYHAEGASVPKLPSRR